MLDKFPFEAFFKHLKHFKTLREWYDQFPIEIKGDFLVVKKEDMEDFLKALDKQYDDWEKKPAGKIDKKD